MNEVTTHHDGLGLNDLILIEHDDPDEKNGSGTHHYEFLLSGDLAGEDDTDQVGYLQFQHGPRNEPGSEPGLTSEAVVCALVHHFESFQAGPYRCRENALVITKLEEALHWMRHRANDRARRGVLGKNEV